MTSRNTPSRNLKSIAGAAVVCLGILVLLGSLDLALSQWNTLLCSKVLAALPAVAPGAWQVIQNYAFGHQQLSDCLCQTLLSFFPLLLVTAAI